MPLRLIPMTLALSLALTGTALAEEAYDTPSGKVRIEGEFNQTHRLFVGNTVLPLEGYASAWLGDRVGNLILIGMTLGGTACPATFAWLDTTPGKVALSDTFGSCSDTVEVSHDRETVTVTMPSMNASRGMVAFDFDGKTVTERVLGLQASGVTGKGPEAWLGKSAYDYLTAPENEPMLIELMGWDALDDARHASTVSSEANSLREDGAWLVASGCQPHLCDTNFTGVALHLETGTPVVALKRDGEEGKLFGKPPSALPADFRRILTGG